MRKDKITIKGLAAVSLFPRLRAASMLLAGVLFTGALLWAVLPLQAQAAQKPAETSQEPSRVVLFGGSNVRTSYMPKGGQYQDLLWERLSQAYPGQRIEVANWADGGETIPRYLLRGAYERHRSKAKGMDVAILRFGGNDQKIMSPAEFEGQLLKFIELLQEDFPGVQIILETEIYVDYPAHYHYDRNQSLDPYWVITRKLSATHGFPLVDYNEATRKATEAGNWDLRIRNVRKAGKRGSERIVFDDSEDAANKNNPRWFSDIHANFAGLEIAIVEEVAVLREVFPDRLPTGQKARARKAHDAAFYEAYLPFAPQKLESHWPNPERDLQTASKAPPPVASGKAK